MLTILQGDVIEQLRTLPDESVHCCVTSPPYWGLRDYGTAQWEGGCDGCDHVERTMKPSQASTLEDHGENGRSPYLDNLQGIPFREVCGKCGAKRIDSQLGLEKTPEEYVAKMVEVFREVRRVLRKDGTLWLNLGDSYAGNKEGNTNGTYGSVKQKAGVNDNTQKRSVPVGLKPKDLCGIPWRVAFALQADGWWLRSDIIWSKPNPMPESVTDRPTKAHEYLFLLTKSANYFYDAEAIKEPNAVNPDWNYGSNDYRKEIPQGGNPSDKKLPYEKGKIGWHGFTPSGINGTGRNKRSVWTVATAPYPEAHFATYPPDLIKPCILSGTSAKGCCAKCGSPWERIVEKTGGPPNGRRDMMPKNSIPNIPGGDTKIYGGTLSGLYGKYGYPETKTIGWQPTCKCPQNYRGILKSGFGSCAKIEPCTVLDPFAGSGTTGAVAIELGRKAVLIELNPKYVELIKTRCNITPGLQLA